MISNSKKLAAVLNKWVQPAIQSLAGTKLMGLPFMANLEAKIKSTGWVSPMWNLSKELSPLMSGISSKLVEPLLERYLQGVPDEAIPQLAHSIVNNALKEGNLSLLEGNVVFEREDLEELSNLLRYNLPIEEEATYEVLEEEPISQGEDAKVIN